MRKYIFWGILISIIAVQSINAQFEGPTTEEKIENILLQLSLEEKVAMCHAQSKFSSPGVERIGIPEIWMSDGPHGVRPEISWDSWSHAGWTNDSATAFPALTCLAATFNPELSEQYGTALGEEARYRKKDIILGPGVNIYRTPLNGRNFEYMGEDPYLASQMVVPYIHGVQKNGVAACVKHFALNNQEVWRNHINVEVSDRALHEIYLPAFKAAVIEGGVWSLMGSYNQFRGQYCSHHEILINQILKGEWNYDGVVISDWGSAHNTKEAALNGLDIEMGTGTDGLTSSKQNAYDYYYLANPFLDLLKSGEIDESVLNDKVRRILRLMFRTNMNLEKPLGKMNNPEHHAVATKVAEEGIVLLKNENHFFPVDPDKKQTIAVIGENATRSLTIGGGSSELKAQFEISPLEGIKNRFKNAEINHTMGYASRASMYDRELNSPFDADSLRKKAIETASSADLVLFIGGLNKSYQQDCEGGDRIHLELPFGQNELIEDIVAANKNTGIIIISGNATSMPWIDKVDGIIQSWYLGSIAGDALASVLSGDANPSGKLPFSFPMKLEDNAAHHFGELSYPGDNINQNYKEDILVGYRWHDTKNIKPLFAFGHGLSYTTFDFVDIKTDKKNYSDSDKIIVSCKVTNTGNINGSEVVQVYIGMPDSAIKRARKELKAFNKVEINSGKSKNIELTIDIEDLAYYDETTASWKVEKGNYKVYVGNASDKITKELEVTIQ